MTIDVTPRTWHYFTSEWDGTMLHMHSVNTDKKCSCGGTEYAVCKHIKAVENYLKDGGKRATRVEGKVLIRNIPETCPVCGHDIEVTFPFRCQGPFWKCETESHYWEWRAGENVKKFLTIRKHPNKLGPFYEMERTNPSVEE